MNSKFQPLFAFISGISVFRQCQSIGRLKSITAKWKIYLEFYSIRQLGFLCSIMIYLEEKKGFLFYRRTVKRSNCGRNKKKKIERECMTNDDKLGHGSLRLARAKDVEGQ